ncbi:cystathionine gamma-synthase [Paramicrobacterium chengjingii]|uniref:Cystathionine gamma-synthase n=1 Tax=Paramicrobacterium chengjingii TaxID=2769067 RepID=A0ABX6YL55_9MICO|nr:cystathionine gamma-synthase [Microbacterium chengjingii]QPZ39075.1 cystathionine gamma-synthase [Microbacterium chengjingii]
MSKTPGFSTRAIHAGQAADPTTGAVIPPIHVTSTHMQDGIGNLREGYEYGRAANPTRSALELQLAALEGAKHAISFSSGLAAEDALLRGILRPGDHVVIGNDVYGGTYRLLASIFASWGIEHTVVDLGNLRDVQAAIREQSKVLWVETPSNPLMKITDIAELTELGHASGLIVVVDNTFATPALQQPLSLGADVVVHSTTKYLGGHSDVVGGAVVLNDAALHEKVRFMQFAAGAVSSPFDAYLTSRGIKTLDVRMERHSANAQKIAEFLEGHDGVERVYYPGLESHPGHALAGQQMSRFGGMLSLALTGGEKAARRFAERLSVFTLAESLGGVESLVNYPSEMTHASVKGTALAVPENVVRLSVGIENVDDLLADVDSALARVAKKR